MSPGCKLDVFGRCAHRKRCSNSEWHDWTGLILIFNLHYRLTINLSYLWMAATFLTFSAQTLRACPSCFFLNSFETWPSQADFGAADMSAPIHNQFFPFSVGRLWICVEAQSGKRKSKRQNIYKSKKRKCSLPPTLAHQYSPYNQNTTWHRGTLFKTIFLTSLFSHWRPAHISARVCVVDEQLCSQGEHEDIQGHSWGLVSFSFFFFFLRKTNCQGSWTA